MLHVRQSVFTTAKEYPTFTTIKPTEMYYPHYIEHFVPQFIKNHFHNNER